VRAFTGQALTQAGVASRHAGQQALRPCGRDTLLTEGALDNRAGLIGEELPADHFIRGKALARKILLVCAAEEGTLLVRAGDPRSKRQPTHLS